MIVGCSAVGANPCEKQTHTCAGVENVAVSCEKKIESTLSNFQFRFAGKKNA
jgi:hypothetical protein